MSTTIKEQMSRYPVFSCPQVLAVDEFQIFRDESMVTQKRNLFAPQLYQKKRNNRIVNIYNKITSNNTKDPLFPRGNFTSQSLVEGRNSEKMATVSTGRKEREKGERTVEKFVCELVTSLSQNNGKMDEDDFDSKSHQHKINLLKRIIEHYNIKSMASDHYSIDLIKTFGLRIENNQISNIAVKKSLHPRKHVIRVNPKTSHASRPNSKLLKSCLQTIQPKALTICRESMDNKISNHSKEISPKESLVPIETESLLNCEITQSKFTTATEKSKRIVARDKIFSIQSKRKLHRSDLSGSAKMRKSLQSTQKLVSQKPFKRNGNSLDSLENKINKYRQFLFILNLSNNLYKQLDIEKYEQSFKFYIGKGNNRNMIKAIMKRRFWFEETNNIQDADFAWTQLKSQDVFDKQFGKVLAEHLQKGENTLTKSELIVVDGKIRTIAISHAIGARKSVKKLDSNDQISRITTVQQNKDYSATLEDMNSSFRKKQMFFERIKPLRKQLRIIDRDLKEKMHNHFPNNGFLGNKKALFYCLKEYCRLTDKKLFEIVPLTFHIKKGLVDQSYKAFMAAYLEKKKSRRPNVWIMKPGQFSNRGQGISCSSKVQEIRKRVNKCCPNGTKPNSLIIQSYITNPLLYNYRKFDIRVFMMITAHNGKIRAYWYGEGYVRTSSFQWHLSDFEDRLMHLTNDAVQKNCYEYGKYETANKLSFSELQRFLDTLPSSGRNMDFMGSVFPKLKEIAADTIKATYALLDPSRLCNNFEIYGLDFMLDDRMKPWLIQVNTNPCLELNCPLLQRVIPYMVENALRIALDPLFPPPANYSSTYKYNIPENAIHYNKFQMVFDEDRDGPGLASLYCGSNLVDQIEDVEEDKEEFDEEGEQIELNDF